jgi:hypothetical protein
MCPQWVDPRKAKFFPECLIEAVDQDAVAAAGTNVARYVCSPFHSVIENINIESTANMDVFLGIDGVAEKMMYRSNSVLPISAATIEDYWIKDKFVATKSFDFMYRGAAAHVWGRWNITTKTPTIIEKLRAKQKLTAEEQQIADNLDLLDHISVGYIPQSPSALDPRYQFTQFTEIERIYRSVAAMGANTASVIGYEINCPQDQVYVLLGVSVDATFAAVFSDSYMIVDRDNDYDYMKMDCSAMPANETVPCFVPFTDKLIVSLESITGSGGNTIECGFLVGKRPRTLIDHIKWGDNLPYRSEVEETEANELINKYTKGLSPKENMLNKIKAGLL